MCDVVKGACLEAHCSRVCAGYSAWSSTALLGTEDLSAQPAGFFARAF